jgi:MFS family permease
MVAPAVSSAVDSAVDVTRVQRHTMRLLFGTQMIGGAGVGIGIAVGALLAASMAGTSLSGLAASASVVGGALLTVPATRLIRTYGRRPGLGFLYAVGALGAVLVVAAAALDAVPLLFGGMMLFGGGTAANLQARYAAVDLAEPDRRGRQLSLIVWATTIGAVAGPNLAPLADRSVHRLGIAEYSGPFAFSALAFLTAAVAITLALRPDPLLTARTFVDVPAEATPTRGMGAAVRVVLANPSARLGIAAVAVGHLVMVAVMSMTPVHIGAYVHQHGDVLRIVGLVLSLHILGMYAFSPVVGWLTDRLGRRPVILGGIATLLAACALAGSAGNDTPRLSVGLALLGLGWSGTMVAGSTLLSESVPVDVRPSVQGLSDVVMGLAGATGGAVSGVIVDLAGYPTLAALAAIATVPLIALASRPVAVAVGRT